MPDGSCGRWSNSANRFSPFCSNDSPELSACSLQPGLTTLKEALECKQTTKDTYGMLHIQCVKSFHWNPNFKGDLVASEFGDPTNPLSEIQSSSYWGHETVNKLLVSHKPLFSSTSVASTHKRNSRIFTSPYNLKRIQEKLSHKILIYGQGEWPDLIWSPGRL